MVLYNIPLSNIPVQRNAYVKSASPNLGFQKNSWNPGDMLLYKHIVFMPCFSFYGNLLLQSIITTFMNENWHYFLVKNSSFMI